MNCVVIRHIAFEHLGHFAEVLESRGYCIQTLDAGRHVLDVGKISQADLLVILGGPIGANDEDGYPFVTDELGLLQERLKNDFPTLGICLGAQLMARALGAVVRKGSEKEIGWSHLTLSKAGVVSPLRHLQNTPVLHWHGDYLDLPDSATNLAATSYCTHQAFSVGRNALGLQFHPEVNWEEFECWLIGHAAEIAQAGLDPRQLRADARIHGPALRAAGKAMLSEWLDRIDNRERKNR